MRIPTRPPRAQTQVCGGARRVVLTAWGRAESAIGGVSARSVRVCARVCVRKAAGDSVCSRVAAADFDRHEVREHVLEPHPERAVLVAPAHPGESTRSALCEYSQYPALARCDPQPTARAVVPTRKGAGLPDAKSSESRRPRAGLVRFCFRFRPGGVREVAHISTPDELITPSCRLNAPSSLRGAHGPGGPTQGRGCARHSAIAARIRHRAGTGPHRAGRGL